MTRHVSVHGRIAVVHAGEAEGEVGGTDEMAVGVESAGGSGPGPDRDVRAEGSPGPGRAVSPDWYAV
ncbi:hypothetical protein [Streptomyces sp. NPDC005930]|uniref:hypothetical protein n=1 Tax=Streptomyces sp. NPDC005930 TaxID=3364736 RepID=UPI0036CFC4BB